MPGVTPQRNGDAVPSGRDVQSRTGALDPSPMELEGSAPGPPPTPSLGDTLPGIGPRRHTSSAPEQTRRSDDDVRDRLCRLGYALRGRLGSGGMGEVWRARSLRLDRDVAIKRVTAAVPGALDRLVHEAKAIARLRHPAIVQVFDIVYDDEIPYLVMELVEGSDLGAVLDAEGPLEQGRAVTLLAQVVAGLHAAHLHDVVHRDVKPDNILLTRDERGAERAVLLDFGISHVASVDGAQAPCAGTPDFMAPEQILGESVGPASDQWSACVTAYCLVTGHSPFHRHDVLETFAAIERAPLAYPRDVELDPGLFAILARGTRKSASERYSDLAELGAALHAWLRRRSPRALATDPWTSP